MVSIGKYLEKLRETAGLTLRQAAELSGISYSYINEIEDDKKSPTFNKVMALLNSYHADVHDFLRETGYLSPSAEDDYIRRIVSQELEKRFKREGLKPSTKEKDEIINKTMKVIQRDKKIRFAAEGHMPTKKKRA